MAARSVTKGDEMRDGDRPEKNGVIAFRAKRQSHPDPVVARVEQYWREVRGNRLVPTRTDIDPRGLTGVLSYAFVLERIATGLARIRIAGSHMTDLMGIEVKGMPLSTVFLPESRQILAEAVEGAFDDPSIIRLRLSAETGFGKPKLHGDMVLLPLRSDLGEVSRILGGVRMNGELGRSPRRLRIELQSREGLTGLGGRTDAEVPAHLNMPATTRGSGIPKDSSLRSPHLQLVVDNAK